MPSLANTLVSKLLLADAQPAFRISPDGRQDWGPGGASPIDTSLYRGGVNLLQIPSRLAVGSEIRGSADVYAYYGDPNNQIDLAAGIIAFGTTAGVNLYRVSSTLLATDAALVVANASGTTNKILLGYAVGGYGMLVGNDVNLFRNAADVWRTNDSLIVDGYLQSGAGTSKAVELGVDRLGGGQASINFGAAADVNLYRSASDALATDDSFETRLNYLYPGANMGTVYPKTYNVNALGAAIGWNFSSGIGEVNLWNTYTGHGNTSPSFQFRQMYATGASYHCLSINGDGTLTIGDPADTNLYRSGPDTLKTDDSFVVGVALVVAAEITARYGSATQVQIGYTGSGNAGIVFGSALDTNLYRPSASADTLKTDDSFIIGGNVGFFNAAAAAKQTVTGSRAANAALASLLTALAAYGLIVNSSTA